MCRAESHVMHAQSWPTLNPGQILNFAHPSVPRQVIREELGLGQIPANGIYTENTAMKMEIFTFDFSLIGHGSL